MKLDLNLKNLNLNLNKKSLVQIVLLVFLVVLGAGAYLYQQEGGLDFITGYFAEEPPATQAPVIRKRPVRKSRAEPAAPLAQVAEAEKTPKPAASPIPDQPAKGQIHGKPFVVEGGTIEDGVLTLRQGKEGATDLEVSINLLAKKWEVPTGRRFKFEKQSGPDVPRIRISWKEDGQSASRKQQFIEQYTLLLELGQEQNRKLPGKINLVLPDETKSMVAGTFEVDIRGFRIINGKPDLVSDSLDTLQFLALRDILKDDPDKPIKDVAIRGARMTDGTTSGEPPTGYLEIEYRVGESAPVVQRFQFAKEKEEWRILRTLNANQIAEAHPYQAPTAKGPPDKLFNYLAAKRLETDIVKSPKKGIFDAQFVTRSSDKHKIGISTLSYRHERNGQRVKTTYLFRLQKNGWVLDRELGKQEKVNFDTGKIEKRKK
ncbi:MAG: hypothetical protein BMS9Abin22_104 [Gammaproteobacteria bacterium]|nr:MAG: hypothetical protein BMS9Abin22_104 [Gammaproteobacteria bacterium]